MPGPIKLEAVGDKYALPCRIMTVIWEGTTTSGDTAKLTDPATGNVLWPGRTSDTETYQGVTFSPKSISCPDGFELSQISAGVVYVYLAED